MTTKKLSLLALVLFALRLSAPAQASLLSGAIYLSGGIIGTLHHLYFSGTPTMELLLSLLPIGLLQTYQSVSVGYWSARSPEFMQTTLRQYLRWTRIVGDMVFAIGAMAFVYFALDLIFRRPKSRKAVISALPESATFL